MTANPVALVTGSTRNIGLATAEALLRAGFDVAVNGRAARFDLAGLSHIAQAHGGAVAHFAGDMFDAAAIAAVFAQLEARFGRLDALINNASIREEAPFERIALSDWHRVLQRQLDGLFLTTQAALPLLRRSPRARIVNIGGLSGHKGARGRAHVVTLKAAVAGFTRALASEFDQPGMTVNTVVPGSIETLRTGPDPGHLRDTGGRRFGRPEEVAFIVAKLCEDGAGYVNGQTIHVNGGSHL